MRLFLTAMLLPVVAWAQLPEAKPVPRVQAVPLPHHITSFQLDGRELTALHHDPQDLRPFWYPFRASRDVSLTRMGHPHDPHGHSHHNSVWVSHSNVNGYGFWGDRSPDKQGRIVTVEIPREGYEDSDDHASMLMVNHWISEADKEIQLVEIRRTEVRPLDGARSWMMIVDMEFYPPAGKKAEFGGTAFGLMAVRVAKNIGVHDGGGRMLNSEGQLGEKAMFRLPAKWVDCSGRITNDEEGFAGVTLMNHPINPQHPTPFHVRNDGWMGACLNFEKSLEVTPEKRLRVRYGLWVHDGVPTSEACEKQWAAFEALPLADLTVPRPKK